jgi:hypothetical protein
MACKRFATALLVAALVLSSCGSRRFPVREPMTRDTDLDPTSLTCQLRPTKDEPRHVACTPRPYVSPLAWDALDNSVFRPISKTFQVDPPREAVNVNALDEAVDSAWFTNRIGARHPDREVLLRGACSPGQILDGENAAPGTWVIDHGKDNGASFGFRIRVGKRKYMLKTDVRSQPERPSAASAIGAAIYHAVGFNTSCEQVVFFERGVLELKPGLTVTDNSGITKPFDAKALERTLKEATRRGPLYRMQASAWLPGYLLGPFRYEATRDDDPNDVIAHENRRELRGARLVAAWLNHFDAREQNTMDVWFASNSEVADSSPGVVRHYYLDTSDSFGSEWDWDQVSRRLGRSYLLDWGDIATDFITLGIPRRPWEDAQRTKGLEQFGYFSARNFDPEAWKNEYPNPAFGRASERDNAWMARILSRFDRGDIAALVELGKFAHREDAVYLADVLEQRLRRILERYLLRLSPLADPRIEQGERMCLTDLARRRFVLPESTFHYAATVARDEHVQRAAVEVQAHGELCMRLTHANNPSASYAIVRITNAASRFPLLVHVYDLGAAGGFRVVGLERPEAT